MKQDNNIESLTEFTTSVGATLKTKRLLLGRDIASIARETKIQARYLQALEESRYEDLPHDVFTLGYLRRYAEVLGLSGAIATDKYILERGPLTPKRQTLRAKRIKPAIVTSRVITTMLIGFVTAAAAAYIGWQAVLLAAPPRLEVLQPPGDQEITSTQLEVTGTTVPGAEVSVNGVSVYVAEDGSFRTTLTLAEGLQTITVTSRNKVGRTTTRERHVLIRPEPID